MMAGRLMLAILAAVIIAMLTQSTDAHPVTPFTNTHFGVSKEDPVVSVEEENYYCSQYVYASSCTTNGCAFCCSAPFGKQCISSRALNGDTAPSDGNSNRTVARSCDHPSYALMPWSPPPPANTTSNKTSNNTVPPQPPTCVDVCFNFSESCKSCTALNWCAYCTSTSTCVGNRQPCALDKFQTVCSLPSSPSPTTYFTVLLYMSIAAVLLTVVLFIGICCRRYRAVVAVGNRDRRDQERQRANNEWLRRLRGNNDTADTTNDNAGEGDAEPAVDEGAPLLANEAASPANENTTSDRHRVSINDAPSTPSAASGGQSPRQHDEELPDEEEEEDEPEPPAMLPIAAEPGEERVCQICLDARPTVVFMPCYHSYCCSECAEQIRPARRRAAAGAIQCPFCRAKVDVMIDLRSLWNSGTTDKDTTDSALKKKTN